MRASYGTYTPWEGGGERPAEAVFQPQTCHLPRDTQRERETPLSLDDCNYYYRTAQKSLAAAVITTVVVDDDEEGSAAMVSAPAVRYRYIIIDICPLL